MPVSCDGEHLEAETVRMWWGKQGNSISSASPTQINHQGNRHLRKKFLQNVFLFVFLLPHLINLIPSQYDSLSRTAWISYSLLKGSFLDSVRQRSLGIHQMGRGQVRGPMKGHVRLRRDDGKLTPQVVSSFWNFLLLC